ncbi:hypothetical protein SASPL_130932 [Salvia splendens]|uniref:ZF-HD dimerization-type domain-containing protein n=1 Tax=Salvia splendens TaxID=180675 RepID=A0A8X8X7U7_SALSN|nr:hypothetical protein SASPL_130932 [Salvia splendens]
MLRTIQLIISCVLLLEACGPLLACLVTPLDQLPRFLASFGLLYLLDQFGLVALEESNGEKDSCALTKVSQWNEGGVVYLECMNHAAHIGRYTVDGCEEFMVSVPSQERPEAKLTCGPMWLPP